MPIYRVKGLYLSLAFFLAFLFAISLPLQAQQTATVLKIVDGDTLSPSRYSIKATSKA